MKLNKENIGVNTLIVTLSISGLLSITTGAVLNKKQFKRSPKHYNVKVIEKSTAKVNNEPKLKDIELEVNMPLSVITSDYIENANLIQINKCKLDTSLVNVNEVGTYTYTITYKDKKFNGKVKVNAKALPIINNMTLKEINVELGNPLPQNLSDYVVETIPEEAKDKIVIDLSKVNNKMAGTYQYTVTYEQSIYTGKVTIYEKKPTIIAPEQTEKENKIAPEQKVEENPKQEQEQEQQQQQQ